MLPGESLFEARPAFGGFVGDSDAAVTVRVFDKAGELVRAFSGKEAFGLVPVLLAAGSGGTRWPPASKSPSTTGSTISSATVSSDGRSASEDSST